MLDEQGGRLDILVNNACLIPPELTQPGPFWRKPLHMQQLFDVGMRSHYVASWHAAPLMVEQASGLVVHTSSYGSVCYMHGPAYGAGKAAVDKMAHDMAVDLRPHGVATVSMLVLRDLQAATDIWNDAETLAIMRPDEPRVVSTYVREFTIVCEEQVVRDAPRTGTCLVGFLRRRESLSAADWRLRLLQTLPSAWLTAGPFAQARRVVLNAVHLPPPPGYEYDAICEWWFDSADDARAAVGPQDLREQLPASLAAIADLARSVFMLTRVTHSRP